METPWNGHEFICVHVSQNKYNDIHHSIQNIDELFILNTENP